MGKGQFERGVRVGRWTYAGGETGTFRRTGARVQPRYGSVQSTNDPTAFSWHPDDWEAIPHNRRMSALRRETTDLVDELTHAHANRPFAEDFHQSAVIRDELLSFSLSFETNCAHVRYVHPIAGPLDTNRPHCAVYFSLWLCDPLPPGDAEMTQQPGPSDLLVFQQRRDEEHKRRRYFVSIDRSFVMSAYAASSDGALVDRSYTLFDGVADDLHAWVQTQKDRKSTQPEN